MKPSQPREFETRTQHSIGVHEENAVEIPLASGEEELHSQRMAFDLVQLRALAEEKEDENWRFRQFLKTQCNLKPEEIDQRVAAATERVWAGIDCTTCANCCRKVRPTFSEEEALRLAQRLEMAPQKFIASYLERTEPGDENQWQTRTTPCPFLKGSRCSVYEDRPADCRGYPYLYEPEFVSRTMGMIERTSTCPIVYEVMEELKTSVGFTQRSRR
jgi:uncharacterized protein